MAPEKRKVAVIGDDKVDPNRETRRSVDATKQRYCSVCKIDFKSYKCWRNHISGYKHKKAKKAMERRGQKHTRYRCKVCAIDMNSLNNLNEHIAGKKHQSSLLVKASGESRPAATIEPRGTSEENDHRHKDGYERRTTGHVSCQENVIIDLKEEDATLRTLLHSNTVFSPDFIRAANLEAFRILKMAAGKEKVKKVERSERSSKRPSKNDKPLGVKEIIVGKEKPTKASSIQKKAGGKKDELLAETKIAKEERYSQPSSTMQREHRPKSQKHHPRVRGKHEPEPVSERQPREHEHQSKKESSLQCGVLEKIVIKQEPADEFEERQNSRTRQSHRRCGVNEGLNKSPLSKTGARVTSLKDNGLKKHSSDLSKRCEAELSAKSSSRGNKECQHYTKAKSMKSKAEQFGGIDHSWNRRCDEHSQSQHQETVYRRTSREHAEVQARCRRSTMKTDMRHVRGRDCSDHGPSSLPKQSRELSTGSRSSMSHSVVHVTRGQACIPKPGRKRKLPDETSVAEEHPPKQSFASGVEAEKDCHFIRQPHASSTSLGQPVIFDYNHGLGESLIERSSTQHLHRSEMTSCQTRSKANLGTVVDRREGYKRPQKEGRGISVHAKRQQVLGPLTGSLFLPVVPEIQAQHILAPKQTAVSATRKASSTSEIRRTENNTGMEDEDNHSRQCEGRDGVHIGSSGFKKDITSTKETGPGLGEGSRKTSASSGLLLPLEHMEKQSVKVLKILNQGTEYDIQNLNGIGKKRAKMIINWRNAVGKFQHITDLSNILGFGEKMLKAILL